MDKKPENLIDVKKFGAHSIDEPGYENFDSSKAIQAAHDSREKGIVFLSGVYRIDKTIRYKKPMKGLNKKTCVLLSGITNGTPVLQIDNTDDWQLANFVINGLNNNCSGLEAVDSSSWYNLNCVDIINCGKDGFKIDGWGGVINDSHSIRNGGNGWVITRAHGLSGKISSDANGGTGVIFKGSEGAYLDILSEGNDKGGIVIDDTNGSVLKVYMEANKQFQLKAGFNGYVNSLSISGISLSAMLENDGGLLFDKVNGLDVNCHCNDDSGTLISTTQNTANTNIKIPKAIKGFVKDSSTFIRKPINYMPNPVFDAWLSGYKDINCNPAHLTLSKETVLYRTGKQALKLQSKPGGADSLRITLPQNVLERLKGKKVFIGAWVYIPDIAEYKKGNFPHIALQTGSKMTTTSTEAMSKGEWNFITDLYEVLDISETDTSLMVRIVPHQNSPGMATGNEYIIVDSIYIGEHGVSSYSDLLYGNAQDDSVLPIINNGNIAIYGASPQEATTGHSNYNVGDRIINTNPKPGSYIGWTCTFGGNKETSVWKGYGLIEG